MIVYNNSLDVLLLDTHQSADCIVVTIHLGLF